MKKPHFLAALACLSASAHAQELPGITDEETVIPFGGVREFHKGHGDVLFVRDRETKWYRIALNKGCLSNSGPLRSVIFDSSGPSTRIDRTTMVILDSGVPVHCRIESIRRSEAPPQVDSKSRVTLD